MGYQQQIGVRATAWPLTSSGLLKCARALPGVGARSRTSSFIVSIDELDTRPFERPPDGPIVGPVSVGRHLAPFLLPFP
jgi:hypothetical protein